jgi:hypothetical protein
MAPDMSPTDTGAPCGGETPAARTARLEELEAIDVAGVVFHPLRRRLGVRSFGINAFSARAAGDQVIEPHDETGSGAGGHEELYLVVRGHARFTVDGQAVDAPEGTVVFVPAPESRREAVAQAPGTTVVVVGGPAGRALPTSPFEFWFAAEPAYRAGDYARAIATVEPGLGEWPDHPVIHYQLACYHALNGDSEAALEHLTRAAAGDARVAEWAAGDDDLAAVRDDPRFPRPS